MAYTIENKTYQYHIGAAKSLGRLPHIHTHLELVYLRSGRAYAYVDRQRHEIGPGELFLAFPNQIHYYETVEPVNILISIFSSGLHRELEKLLAGKIPVTPVLSADLIPKETEHRLMSILKKRRSGDSFEKLSATGELLSLISELLPRFSYHEVPTEQDSVKRILEYCSTHYTEPITLEVLAEELYLSKYYISRVFHERMEFSFTEFIGNLRVNFACDQLRAGESITRAGLSSGFASIRSFNRVFLKVMGMTPREYVRQIQGEKS